MNWFRHDAFGSQVSDWLALTMVVLLSFALGIALLRLVSWLLRRERDADDREGESEKEYWRIHGG